MTDIKPALLFLSHRIPYPPNKGDKIRSWHLLKHLAKTHRVFLGTFVDDEKDWKYIKNVKDVCEGTYFARLEPAKARVRSLSALLKDRPLTLPYYADKELSDWVEYIVERNSIKKAVVYSSAMAQYVLREDLPLEQRIIDFVDVDSDKWKQFASNKAWPLSAIYRREADKLLEYEQQTAEKFDYNLFVSDSEAELFRQLAPDVAEKVTSYNNGVDSCYFSPAEELETPYEAGVLPIVFTGAMDYWPNVDAVKYFALSVLPQVKKRHPEAEFYIVGNKPSPDVKELEQIPGVVVTGWVEDIRPYIKHASVAVAPMRIARGVQNKVLEAMAMKKPVVVSPQGLEGIEAVEGEEVLVASEADEFADRVVDVLEGLQRQVSSTQIPDALLKGDAARKRILSDFDWDRNLTLLDMCLSGASAPVESERRLQLVDNKLQESA